MEITGSRGPLLTSNWAQGASYNRICSLAVGAGRNDKVYRSPDDLFIRCPAGCVAIAGAQVMRYWAWPPRGRGGDDGCSYEDTYDWVHMADDYEWSYADSRWHDGAGNLLSDFRADAVLELLREVGAAVGLDYCLGGGRIMLLGRSWYPITSALGPPRITPTSIRTLFLSGHSFAPASASSSCPISH